MTALASKAPRRLVPRWRYGSRTILTAEHGGDPTYEKELAVDQAALAVITSEWDDAPSIRSAAELVSFAAATKQTHIGKAAARYLLKHRGRLLTSLEILAEGVLEDMFDQPSPYLQVDASDAFQSSAKSAVKTISEARSRLRADPRNVWRYLDLARAYIVLGLTHKADIAVRRALSLAPNHRVVLRIVSRFLVHLDRLEQARSLITRHSRTPHDPWLISTEIALSSLLDRSPKFYGKGKKLLGGGGLLPGHQTELAAAIGTLEWEAGRNRSARQYLRRSLIEPTENVVAQIQTIMKDDQQLQVDSRYLEMPDSYEARYLKARADGQFDTALHECQDWLLDEPFSGRPATDGSFLAVTVLQDGEIGEQFARTGLRADPEDHTLRNNLAVALGYQGRIEDAEKEFARITRPFSVGYNDTVYLATKGLIAYRKGLISDGRSAYSTALERAGSHYRPFLLVHWAREELLVKGEMVDSIFDRIVSTVTKDEKDATLKKVVHDLKSNRRWQTLKLPFKGEKTLSRDQLIVPSRVRKDS